MRKFKLGVPRGFADRACRWAFYIGCWPVVAWWVAEIIASGEYKRDPEATR